MRHTTNLLLDVDNEDNELHRCQQYLQLHSGSPPSALTSANGDANMGRGGNTNADAATGSRLPNYSPIYNNHLAPCSCELRKHFVASVGGFSLRSNEYVWLTCDHVQLIGNQMFSANQLKLSSKNEFSSHNISKNNNYHANNNNKDRSASPSRYSQRDAGLQILHAQKFHYLQLSHLESIDLANNRLRSIKMDAFHGLENTLEYLNLANNLLGDTRVNFGAADTVPAQQQQPAQAAPSNRIDRKSIFPSDELNRLKKLKWLSLQNNQISHLSPQTFARHSINTQGQQVISSLHFDSSPVPSGARIYNHQQQQQQHQDHNHQAVVASELIYIDLSDNLLKSIPSDSIWPLPKLKILKLNKNRVEKLNEQSKFPDSLEYLDLSENLISVVHNCDLIDLPNLIELNLSNNLLRHLDQTAFVSTQPTLSHNPQDATTHYEAHNHDQNQPITSANSALGGAGATSVNQFAPNEVSKSVIKIGQIQSGDHEQQRQQHYDGRAFNQVDKLPTKRRRRETTQVQYDNENLDFDAPPRDSVPVGVEERETDDLQTGESILATVKKHFKSNTQPSVGEELNIAASAPSRRSHSMIRLNLSYNFFEVLPGDSLVKFANLQQLDLSYNRIRDLDPNYLCSVYNLVDNLKVLDLSGNLLELSKQTLAPVDSNNAVQAKQLNKYFGCVQKLEKLFLGTNRLVATNSAHRTRSPRQYMQPVFEPDDPDIIQIDESGQSEMISEDSTNAQRHPTPPNGLLSIKFGDGLGNKNLNTLDLSDNQLRQMPVIEYSMQPLNVLAAEDSKAELNRTSMLPNQAQLNQWISSRIQLEVLNLNYNQLERLGEQEFEHLFNLRQLHLDFNKLTSLPAKLLRHFICLDRLSAAGNRLASLDPLDELLERSARTLRSLNLANNRLMEWPQLSKATHIADHTGQQSELRKIFGTDHEHRQLMVVEFALEELNLEGNRLTSVNVTSLFDQLAYMKSLNKLNLNYNLLNRIKSEWFKFANKNLIKLSFVGNKINNIDLGSFALNQVNELTSLDLEFNLLKELRRKTFDSLPKLGELNLANNLIHTINSETFYQMNSLRVLKLNNNKLTSWKCEYFSHLCNSISGNINVNLASLSAHTISENSNNNNNHHHHHQTGTHSTSSSSAPFPTVSSLVELDLSHNSLSQLRANSISVHSKLVKLNLAYNKLSFIPHDLFKANTVAPDGRQVYLVSSLKYLNLEHNRIQTIDNINFKPLRNLLSLDLSHNELQTLGLDVVTMDVPTTQSHAAGGQRDLSGRHTMVSNNLTNLFVDDDELPSNSQKSTLMNQTSSRSARSLASPANWPSLCKLRHLNLAFNQLTMVNQSLLSELSPFVLLNLNLSHNYLETESLPSGFYTKLISYPRPSGGETTQARNYDLVYTLKLESLDISHNRLGTFPSNLLDNHYSSMEACNLSHNRLQNLPQNSNPMVHIKSLNFEFNPLNRESSELLLFEQKSARSLNLAATRLYAIQQTTADINKIPLVAYTHHQMKNRLINQTSQLDLIRSINKPIDAPYLRHLNLSSNQLVWLSANVFERMYSLRELDLSHNQLTRLHLLTNQLSHVSPTLEYLNLRANLFTNIDSNDFTQLEAVRHLDLSNLLSLRKINCKFLSKLNKLKVLRMFNYPQVRNNLASLLGTLTNPSPDSAATTSEKFKRKTRNDLILSTIGQHCFDATQSDLVAMPSSVDDPSSGVLRDDLNWVNLEELELEVFNNFDELENNNSMAGGGFDLGDQLRQLIGPRMRKLTLIGLNLTTLSENSLLGITNEDLTLKISYTSISQLPLKQILESIPRKTKLDLDLRNNNIQTIDTNGLQWLDEFQQMSRIASPRNEYPTLKLASNPFRCDCQARPLWLWLNQRWDNIEVPSISDEQIGDTSSANSANYYLKFHPYISQTSDLRCFYPIKLRGRPAQHVNYNDLVCKGSSGSSSPIAMGALPNKSAPPKRRQNDTSVRLSETYYLTSLSTSDLNDFDDLDDDDYLDASESRGEQARVVKVTRFNRYPSAINNSTSMYFSSNFPSQNLSSSSSHVITDYADQQPFESDNSNRIGKRDQNSAPENNAPGAGSGDSSQTTNTKYAKHRPNTQQKHSAYFSTFSNLNQIQFGRNSLHAAEASGSPRRALLTDSDVFILTVAGGAMGVMSFVIMAICLLKYKLDHSDQEQILKSHTKMLQTQPMVISGGGGNFASKSRKSSQNSSSNSSVSKKLHKSSTHSDTKLESSSSGGGQSKMQKAATRLAAGKQQAGNATIFSGEKLSPEKIQRLYASQILVPISQPDVSILARAPPPPSANNFLMRSPTIRRMHGLAGDASHWFRYNFRLPNARGTRHRPAGLFTKTHNGTAAAPPAGYRVADLNGMSSQLTTSSLHKLMLHKNPNGTSAPPPILLTTGCPLHAFKCIQKMSSASKWHSVLALNESPCSHCSSLLAAFHQTTRGQSSSSSSAPRAMQTGVAKHESSSASSSEYITTESTTPKVGAKRQSGDNNADQNEPQLRHKAVAEQQVPNRTTIGVEPPPPPPAAAAGVSTSRLTENEEQQQQPSFQAAIGRNQSGSHMPPKMVKALAKQVGDSRFNNGASYSTVVGGEKSGLGDGNNCWNKAGRNYADDSHYRVIAGANTAGTRTSANYYSREQPVRCMQTFGVGSRHHQTSNARNQIGSTSELLPDSQSTSKRNSEELSCAGLIASQIPTIDVDGVFTYQSRSQIESPTHGFDAQLGGQLNNQGGGGGGNLTPSSTVATNQEDMFVLVRDSPSQCSFVNSQSSHPDRGANPNLRHTNYNGPQQHTNGGQQSSAAGSQMDIGSSLMNDECSRTSSPMAYGFMRSSPSATTTLSSSTITNSQTNGPPFAREPPSPNGNEMASNYRQVIDRFRRAPARVSHEDKLSSKSTHQSATFTLNTTSGGGGVNCFNNNNNNNNNYNIETSAKEQVAPSVKNQIITSGGAKYSAEPDSNQSIDDQVIISRL